jgi:crooked neck
MTFISNILFQSDEGWEEFFDYIFPEDEATKPNLKLLEMAKAWKRQKEKAEEQGEEEGKGTK